MAVISVTEQNFESVVLNAQKPVLIDFYATWCGPCKMLSPLVDEVAKELAGDAVVVKVNVDDAPSLASKFGVSAIPTLVVVKNGKPYRQSVGYISKEEILDLLK